MSARSVWAVVVLGASFLIAPGCKCSRDTPSPVAAPSASATPDPDDELCKRYESCGCRPAAECLAGAKKPLTAATLAKVGVRECLIASRCASLCEGRPDQCGKLVVKDGGSGGGSVGGTGSGGGGAGAGHGSRRCAETTCSEDAAGMSRCAAEGCGSCLLGHCVVF